MAVLAQKDCNELSPTNGSTTVLTRLLGRYALGGLQEIEAASCTGIGVASADLDRALMLRAVSNLVSNAISHTPSGGSVTLAASATAAEIRIKVSDTGTGIPAEALPRVFDRFFRVDPSRSKTSGGTGLGLAIVQSVVSDHRGRISVESAPGKGTTFRIELG